MAEVRTGTISEMVASIPDNEPMRNPPASQMLLRDYLAAHALASGKFELMHVSNTAALCYSIADAMLAERLKRTAT